MSHRVSERPLHTNRLARESSPYLLQHQHNPVDWYPWGPEAFAAARESGKAIFLSVGYSTCYWCHVMERQCFEVEAIAAEMNKRFICIKVDREERPDVDSLYMTALQVLTRHGGWPMSVWMTPTGRPFYAGTYFPPEDMGRRPGFPRLLAALDEAWRERRGEIEQTADGLLGVLHQLAAPARPSDDVTLDLALVEDVIRRSIADYEPEYGGFGTAPKFPRETLLLLLLDYLETTGTTPGPDEKLRTTVAAMLDHTLDEMDRGGLHDHLGGGFHRYSTDANWLVPHFEIMLYDQAMLAEVYARAARVLNNARWAGVARGVCDFVLREMTAETGAFYTALDAEVDHQEGLNYLWTQAEIEQLLGPELAATFNCVYGVDQGPNFADPHHGNGEPTANILFLDRPLESAAHDHGLPLEQMQRQLAEARRILKAARDKRKQPLLDTKVLTSWNALMAGALATVGRELSEPRYAAAAARACTFLLARHSDASGGLLRTSRGTEPAKYSGFLDDYAALADACLRTGDGTLAVEAGRIADTMLLRFGVAACGPKAAPDSPAGGCCGGGTCGSGSACGGGGLFFTAEFEGGDHEPNDGLIVRQKVGTDSPLPSGNAQAATVLLALGRRDPALALLSEFAGALSDNGESMSGMMRAVLAAVSAGEIVTVRGRAAGHADNRPASPESLAERVVDIDSRFVAAGHMRVRLSIADGYHLQGPAAVQPLVATTLRVHGARVEAPPTKSIEMPGAGVVEGYIGEALFDVFLAGGATLTGDLEAVLTYQVCDESSCLPPVTRAMQLVLGQA